ncbi:MAG: helix-turn-helix transcriptional regulator [Dehalococcoidia bacterium]
MQRTRRQILDCIKLKGSMSIDQLGGELGVMPVTIRAHVNVLERDHLLQGSERRTGRAGRPCRVYSLTEEAQELFPQGYDNLATSILDNIRKLQGEETLEQMVKQVGEDKAEIHAESIHGKDMDGKVEQATEVLNQEGCLAKWEKAGDKYVLTAYNCPYLHVAEHSPEICGMEVAFLKNVLSAQVKLVSSVTSGDPNCVFNIEGC